MSPDQVIYVRHLDFLLIDIHRQCVTRGCKTITAHFKHWNGSYNWTDYQFTMISIDRIFWGVLDIPFYTLGLVWPPYLMGLLKRRRLVWGSYPILFPTVAVYSLFEETEGWSLLCLREQSGPPVFMILIRTDLARMNGLPMPTQIWCQAPVIEPRSQDHRSLFLNSSLLGIQKWDVTIISMFCKLLILVSDWGFSYDLTNIGKYQFTKSVWDILKVRLRKCELPHACSSPS